MAWTVTSRLTQVESDGGSSSATETSGSFTPAANALLCVFAIVEADGGNTNTPSWSITDNLGAHLTWTTETTSAFENVGGFGGNVVLFTAPTGASPSSMTVTVDPYSGSGAAFYGLQIFDITDGSGVPPVKAQNAANAGTASSGNSVSLTVTLGSNPTNGNLVLGLFGAQNDTSATFATISGFTALSNLSGVNQHTAVFYRSDTTTAGITNSDLGQTINWGGAIAYEVKAGAAGASIPPGPVINPTLASIQGANF